MGPFTAASLGSPAGQSSPHPSPSWRIYRPREANVIADHLAGVASSAAARALEDGGASQEFYVQETGAIILGGSNGGATILHLIEIADRQLEEVGRFLRTQNMYGFLLKHFHILVLLQD